MTPFLSSWFLFVLVCTLVSLCRFEKIDRDEALANQETDFTGISKPVLPDMPLGVTERRDEHAAYPEDSTTGRRFLRHLSSSVATSKQSSSYSFSSKPDAVQSQIIGGTFVLSPYVYPFYSSIYYGATELCGATLVAPDLLLTAGHCTTAFFPGSHAVVGAILLEQTIDGYSFLVNVTQTLRNPLYRIYHNDLMLVKISPAMKSIQPATINFNSSIPELHQNLTIIGFGSTRDGYHYANVLQRAMVAIVPYDTCLENYSNLTLVENQHICVEGTNPLRITCSGDSGGPLLLNGDTVVGVLSYGAAICTDGPSVFTRTAHYQQWLTQSMCNLSDYNPAGSVACHR